MNGYFLNISHFFEKGHITLNVVSSLTYFLIRKSSDAANYFSIWMLFVLNYGTV